ncbi:hypothetical protein SAMN05216489_06055 [Streptomyces sp. 3213]|uniref:hypothetical protein n=1 Tax=Streptomyces sp. 3213.3 TaxID=1855348 RepID=UPI00089BDF0A|nr:hypothetical protein [Streptomyces sp. 3213.3]SEE27550.1 hypothetical protein SAMN05216489_06055 [Streptomyces sp. 3213] [Streptomyces sp. 3213.3]
MTTSYDASGVHPVLGVDAGTTTLREADHLVRALASTLALPPGTVACTHLIRTDARRGTAVSLELPDHASAANAWRHLTESEPPPGHREAAAHAAAEHTARRSGRAVLFPGAEHLTGTIPLSDLLELTAIDRVTVVGATSGELPAPTTPVHTQNHVRPEWRDGELVLALVPAVGNTLAPFEVPNPTPCCADHP